MARIAFIGLGNMGGGMAANLAKAGHDVRAFDLSEEALDQGGGARLPRAGSAAEAVADAEAVVTMLPAGKHVRDVYEGAVIGTAPASAILIDCSTIDVATAREEIEKARGRRLSDGRRAGLRRHRRGRGRHAHLHGRRQPTRRSSAPSRILADDGQGGDPCRRPGLGPGGQDLQQHAARRLDGRDLRDLRAGAEARPRPADLLRHRLQGVGPVLVDDQLLPGARASARRRRPTAIMKAASRRR